MNFDHFGKKKGGNAMLDLKIVILKVDLTFGP